ncbi:kinase-like domain-containing protein [Endogone sp. FLAS-F59071]|nr:kinase-like domain-containing protein [Endogone sp. FLAS-F59071]|eukprot:RUS19895.1 kinase-like domain-containing protein [Endogone sp. FLAS-F59071]
MAKHGTNYREFLYFINELKIHTYDLKTELACSFEVGDRLGKGAFMTVYRGILNRRKARTSSCQNPYRRGSLRYSAICDRPRIADYAKHPNIIHLYGIAFVDLKPVLLVEFAVSTLEDYLKERKEKGDPVDWATKADFCCDIADGLHAVRVADVIHGDVKGDNALLFSTSEGSGEYLTAKVADFGNSAAVERESHIWYS